MYFCTQIFIVMIDVSFDNTELKSLMLDGKSTQYKEVVKKKGFIDSLQAFMFLLRILRNTKELLLYKQYWYKPNVKESYVLINGSNVQRKLLFTEQKQGTQIVINDLIK